ncbi:mucin-4 [Patella vulgata]|uniref:mucin-4 n=1 Tax=Patella vulgata TaxID=6465 RepID=UPI00217FF4D9|nr:mucin-4 [Patella vulgata]
MGNKESSQNSDVYSYHEDVLKQGAEAITTGSDDDSSDEEMQEGPSQSKQNESDDTNGSSNEDVAVNDKPSSENSSEREMEEIVNDLTPSSTESSPLDHQIPETETSSDTTPSSTESSPVDLRIPESSSLANQNKDKEDQAAFVTPPSSRENSPVPRRSRRFSQNVSKDKSATKQRLSMRDSDDSQEEMLTEEPKEEFVAVVTRSKTTTLITNEGSSEGQPEKISEATTSSKNKQLDNKSTIKSRKRSISDTSSDSPNKPAVKTTGGFDRPFVTAERGIHMTKKNAVHLQKVFHRSSSKLKQIPIETEVSPSSSASYDSVTEVSTNPNDNKKEKVTKTFKSKIATEGTTNHRTSQDRPVNKDLAESEARVNGSTEKSKDNQKGKNGASRLNVLESTTATEETTVHRTSQVKDVHKSLVGGSGEKSALKTETKRIMSTELTSTQEKSLNPLSVSQNKRELSKILVKKSVDRFFHRSPIDEKLSGAPPVKSPSSNVDRPATTGVLISPVAKRENNVLKKSSSQSSHTERNTSQNNNVTEEPMDTSSSASGTNPSEIVPASLDKNRKSIKSSSNISEISIKKAKIPLADASASGPILRVPLMPSTGVVSPVQVVPGASMDLPKIPIDPRFSVLPISQQTATTPSPAASPAQPMTSGPDHGVFQLMESFNMSVKLGDITEQRTEAIVNTTDRQLAHVGGVARHIAAAAGQQMINECQAILNHRGRPLETMDVIDTCAGGRFNRRVKKLLHVVSAMGSYRADKAVVDKLIHTFLQCLKHADRNLDCSSISFPLLGAGSYLPDTSINAFYNAVLIFLSDRGPSSKLNDVRLILNDVELHQFAVDYFGSCYENILTNGIEGAIADAVNSLYGNNTWETQQKLLNRFTSGNNGRSGGGGGSSSSDGGDSAQNLFRGSAVKRPRL